MESNLTSVDAIEEGGSSSNGGTSNEKKSCAICGTSATPLWRNGPAGPKSLCNACGIRNRKKRRAEMEIKSEDKKEKNLGDSFKQRLMELGREVIQIPIKGIQVGRETVQRQEPSSSNKWIGKSKSWITRFLVVINLLLEIVSAVADQLSSIRKPHFARISLLMSILSLVLSIIDLTYKTRAHKARFLCKWPIPWFYYPSRGYNRIFGSFTDTVLLFCAVGQLIVSTINYSFIERRRDGPIKVSVWPLFFAIGMVVSKFMEKPTISMENSCNNNVSIQTNESIEEF